MLLAGQQHHVVGHVLTFFAQSAPNAGIWPRWSAFRVCRDLRLVAAIRQSLSVRFGKPFVPRVSTVTLDAVGLEQALAHFPELPLSAATALMFRFRQFVVQRLVLGFRLGASVRY